MLATSIVEKVLEHVAKHPDRAAVIDGEGVHTYRQLVDTMRMIASFLKNEGQNAGDRIIVECTQNFYFLACGLACHLSGLVFVPVERNASGQRVQEVAHAVDADLIIAASIKSDEIRTVDLSDIMKTEVFSSAEYAPLNAEALAEILYTTGTTGAPKGIMISNRNNVAVAENIVIGTQMKPQNVELIPLPLSHSHGLRTCYANLLNGSTVVLFDGVMNVKKIYHAIREYHVTALDLSPSAAKVLLKISKGMFRDFQDQIDYVELGTAVLDEDTKTALKQTFPQSRLYNFYGSTEAGRSCILDFNSDNDLPNCIGYPACNAKFMIADQDKKHMLSSPENPGILAVSGGMNMLGYWNDSVATSQAMSGGWIYTSDLAYMDDKDRIFVLGRADDVINYKGIKIAPDEIETPAKRYEGIIDCACVAMEDKMCGQSPHLYIQVTDPAAFDLTAYTEYLHHVLNNERMPKRIDFIERIPRTSNGKLQRRLLRT